MRKFTKDRVTVKQAKEPSYGYGEGILSNSMIHMAIGCHHKFKVKYIQQASTSVESSFFKLGKVVHKTIENYYDYLSLANAPNSSGRNLSDESWLLEELDSVWAFYFDEELVSSLKQYGAEYEKAVVETNEHGVKFKGRKEPYTAPEKTNYWKDQVEARLTAFEKDLLGPQMSRFTDIRFKKPLSVLYYDSIKCIKNFLKMHNERTGAKSVFSEFRIDPPLIVYGQPKSGSIDRIEFNVNPETGEYTNVRIGDYKTGKSPWTRTDVANSDQLGWYDYAIQEIWGVIPEAWEIWDLFNGQVVVHEPTEEDRERFKGRLRFNAAYINLMTVSIKEALQRGDDAPLYIPAGNKYSRECKTCDLPFETNPEARCPYYKHYDDVKLEDEE